MIDAAEIERIVITDNGRDLSDCVVGGFQQILRVVHTDVEDVLLRGYTVYLLEVAHEQADTGMPGLGILFNIDGLVVMLVEILTGKVHLLLNSRGNKRRLLKAGALDHQEQLAKVHLQHLPVPNLAVLKLLDHVLEQLGVGCGRSGKENVLVQRNVIGAQNLLYRAAGKVNPVDFGLVFAEILVVLLLLGLEKYHVTGSHNLVFPANVKVGFTGSNKQQLPVNASTGSPGRQFFVRFEAVCTTAAHDQRLRLVFERQLGVVQIARIDIHMYTRLSEWTK